MKEENREILKRSVAVIGRTILSIFRIYGIMTIPTRWAERTLFLLANLIAFLTLAVTVIAFVYTVYRDRNSK